MTTSLKVAVIGAGLSGLLAGRELVREGHRVVVYEKSDRLGGTWVYDPRVDSDPLGLSPDREIVHGSLYRSLRTNLPRPIMGFSDYSFEDRVYGDGRNFPGHEEVLKFLEEFARDFGLGELIRFGSEVVRVERVDSASNDEWVVESRVSGVGLEVEVFEAVVVCNGRNTEPRLANFPGIEKWPGKQLHSHNYRVPEPYRDQVVVMIGNGPSAYDISREVATVAKQVHLSSRSPNIEVSKFKNYDNIWQHSKISYVDEDGTVAFEDGFSIQADTIFHCTGYKFHFPFLKTNGIVCVEDKRVEPLYKHVFPPQLAPRLSFIGVKAIIFCFFELQSKWVAKTLSGEVSLPSKEEMMADVEQHYHHMEGSGIPKHQTHSPNPLKLDYLDWLGDQVGSPVEDRVKETYVNFVNYFISNQEGFRDKFLQSSQQLPCDDQSI